MDLPRQHRATPVRFYSRQNRRCEWVNQKLMPSTRSATTYERGSDGRRSEIRREMDGWREPPGDELWERLRRSPSKRVEQIWNIIPAPSRDCLICITRRRGEPGAEEVQAWERPRMQRCRLRTYHEHRAWQEKRQCFWTYASAPTAPGRSGAGSLAVANRCFKRRNRFSKSS
jgi:hypothetical protein